MKNRVYVESSVIGYLTSRPSRDVIRLGKQRLTMEWWECRHEWDLVISQTVLQEIGGGDREAAEKRLVAVREVPVLPVTPEAQLLADDLVARGAVPMSAATDALHLALAAQCKARYLVTWNQKHLDNPDMRVKIESIICQRDWSPAIVLTPERLLEVRT